MFSGKIAAILFTIFLSSSPIMAQNDLPEISDAELEKFSLVFEDLRSLDKEIQSNMIRIVSEEEMEIGRFNEIYKKDLDPEREIELSGEEKEHYEHIVEKIEKLQLNFQKDMKITIQDAGLSVEKYQQIATRLQLDPVLQERLRNHMKD